MKIIKPERLQRGDVVGIVSPSAPITQNLMKQFDRGIKTLQSLDLKIKYSKHDEDEIGKILDAIKKSSEKAYELTENLLLWANSQTGKIAFDPSECSLRKIIGQTIDLATVSASMKQIRILFVMKEDCVVKADVQMAHTVLRNLLSNAIKFTPEGGVISVSSVNRENYCEISVRDTGVGIPPEYIEKLFRIDSKYSTPGTNEEKGSGLGLILCREFVEKNGGKIWAESRPGKGSVFFFTLPKQ